MDQVEELRRVVRGYRNSPPRSAPAGLLDAIRKLDDELGPSKGSRAHVRAGGNLERDLHNVASELTQKGGVSHVAGTLLHGILGELATPGRQKRKTTQKRRRRSVKEDPAYLTEQPLPTGQIPESYTGAFPDAQ